MLEVKCSVMLDHFYQVLLLSPSSLIFLLHLGSHVFVPVMGKVIMPNVKSRVDLFIWYDAETLHSGRKMVLINMLSMFAMPSMFVISSTFDMHSYTGPENWIFYWI